MGSSINNQKMTIGGAESTAGEAVSRTVVVPMRASPSLRSVYETAPDPAITGANMITGKFALAQDVAGGVPVAFRPVAGVGKLINSLLGQEVAPVQVEGAIKIRFTGSEASCKISADTTGDTLTSEIGVKGAEAGDANFGTAGDIDLTAVGTDTLGELIIEIDGYSEYDCEKLFGIDAVDAADIIDITSQQAANGWTVIYFSSAASGIYLHQWPVILTNTERPTYSVQIDGRQDAYLFDGCVTDQLTLAATLKAFVESEATILGMKELAGQTPSVLTLADIDPLRFHAGTFTVAAVEYPFCRNHNLTLANNHNPEGYGKGLLTRQYHEKGLFAASGDMQLRLDAVSILEYPKVAAGTKVSIWFDYYGKALATDINEMVYIEMPYCILDDFEWQDNAGVLDAKIPFTAVNPLGTPYNSAMMVSMLTADSAAY